MEKEIYNKKKIMAADLFCGAGGTSSGLLDACNDLDLELWLLAINHWEVAIATHSANHRYAKHLCESLDAVDPRKVVPGGKLRLLVASPECTHHSVARGGTPCSDQSRASAWHVLRWAEALHISDILIENVPEWRSWCPLGANGRPMKSKLGETYQAFLNALRSLGYVVEDRVLCAADFGDPTSRHRLFVRARKGNRAIAWPEVTNAPRTEGVDLPKDVQPYRTARSIIDWNLKGKSVFNRNRPLAEKTMKRILAGLKKFSGTPFIVGAGGPAGQGRPASVESPLQTVLAENHRALVEPFLVKLYGTSDAVSIDEPCPTVTAGGQHIGLAEPCIVPVRQGKGNGAFSVENPIPTEKSMDGWAIAEPYLVEYHNGNGSERRTRSVDGPLPTVDCSNRFALAEPFIISFYNRRGLHSVEEPLPAVTCKERFGVVIPFQDGYAVLDILFRMLTPEELARAHSLDNYVFAGTREEKVRQIGNSVPRRLARALCYSALAV